MCSVHAVPSGCWKAAACRNSHWPRSVHVKQSGKSGRIRAPRVRDQIGFWFQFRKQFKKQYIEWISILAKASLNLKGSSVFCRYFVDVLL